MKRMITMLLIALMLFSVIVPCYASNVKTEQEKIFDKAYIARLAARVLPEDSDSIAKRQFLCNSIYSILVETGYSLPRLDSVTEPFVDTYNPAISVLYNMGIVKGVSENRFNPNHWLTNEQIATIVYRLLLHSSRDYFEKTVEPDPAVISSASDWARDGLDYLISIGFFEPDVNPAERVLVPDLTIIVWKLYLMLGGEDVLLIEDASDTIVADVGIASFEDIKSSDNITYGQAFSDILYVFWNERFDGEELIASSTRFAFMDKDEASNINLESDISEKRAMVALIKLACGVNTVYYYPPMETQAEIQEIYNSAVEKGIIESADITNANAPITKEKFYGLLKKVLFCEWFYYTAGGSVFSRYIDGLLKN